MDSSTNNITTNTSTCNTTTTTTTFVCNLSREQIRAQRKIKRAAKKESLKVEKQKERERKQYEDILNRSKSEKVKLIGENEMNKYRTNLVENGNISSQNRTNSERQSFHVATNDFPDLSENFSSCLLTPFTCVSTILTESASKSEVSTQNQTVILLEKNTIKGQNSSSHKTFAQNVFQAQYKADVVRWDENSFPKLNQDESSQRNSELNSCVTNVTYQIKREPNNDQNNLQSYENILQSDHSNLQSGLNEELLVNDLKQSHRESGQDQNLFKPNLSNIENNLKTNEIGCENCPDIETFRVSMKKSLLNKSDLNEKMNSIETKHGTSETKPETSETKPGQSNNMIETNIDDPRKYKRRPYCCNLLQYTKIKQMKNQPKSMRKQKTTSLSQNQGNPLDSTKPVQMNKGKHYVMRDKVIRKNKIQTTKTKKIIYNYRQLKNDTNFIRKPNFNILLTREFLDLLNCHIERDFKFKNQHEKQILLFTEFINKKNKNKLWDCMRETIESNDVRVKDMKPSDRNDTDNNQVVMIREELECNKIVESDKADGLLDPNKNIGDTIEESYQTDVLCKNMDSNKSKEILPGDLDNNKSDSIDAKDNLCNKTNDVQIDREHSRSKNSIETIVEISNRVNEIKTNVDLEIQTQTDKQPNLIRTLISTVLQFDDEKISTAVTKEPDKLNATEKTKAVDKQINNSIVNINETSHNKQITSSIDKQINETSHNNQITSSIDKQINETSHNNEITSSIDKQINEISHNNQITSSIDKQINETSQTKQIITNTKKLKRLEKKKRKRESAKLDETIVANKSKDDGGEDSNLNLNKIVDTVVRREDVDQLCAVKQQIHSRNFRPYCNQLPLPRLRKVSTDLIKQIVLFQERLFKSDPNKGRTRRRYLVGVKEVLKSLPIRNKVKILFVAPDLECVPLPGGIDDNIQSLLTMSTIQGVPYLFCLSRRMLGSLTHKPAASCLAVLDYSGAEEMAQELFILISEAKTMYDDRVLSLSNSLSNSKATT